MKQKTAIKQLKEIEKLNKQKGNNKLRLAAEWKQNWKILISTILSAQTKDETTIKICEKLFKKYPTIEKLSNAPLEQIKKIIKPINYYKTKSKNIKQTSKILSKKQIPKTINELLELPGVGRKTANVYLLVAHNKNVVGVDTHVARISKKLNWTTHKQNQKYKIEKDLEELFPKKYHGKINWVLVRFGRTFGKSRKKEDEILEKIKSIGQDE